MITAKREEIPLKTAASKIRLGGMRAPVCEIRLRSGKRAVAVTADGAMTPCSEPFSPEEIADCFAELCRYSVHSYAREIAEGFVTLDGGHRVGICGTAVVENGKITALRDISSLNIRIAREFKGCGEELYRRVFLHGPRSLLLAGKPMSGKTTVLRDLSRLIGAKRKVALIDSRNELSAMVRGAPTLDVGDNTDVLCGCPKSEGIMLALRALSPEVIICDEIGDDYEAVKQCIFCGVKLIAAAHAGDFAELSRRAGISELLPLFDCAAVLKGLGETAEVYEAKYPGRGAR